MTRGPSIGKVPSAAAAARASGGGTDVVMEAGEKVCAWRAIHTHYFDRRAPIFVQ
jgi:hypothetical protein